MQDASYNIWMQKYRLTDRDGEPVDVVPNDTLARVARALASVEPVDQPIWYARFLDAMRAGAYPAGRILSNLGAGELKPNTSAINCVVSRPIGDSIGSIFGTLHDAAITLARGSGIGYCCSTLRPRGAHIGGVGAKTSGPIPFMRVYDAMCQTISSAGGRRGAQMLTMHCWHPDIMEFIACKEKDGEMRQFNLSVLITDDFMDAVEHDRHWHLYFPLLPSESLRPDDFALRRPWALSHDYAADHDGLVTCKVYDTVRARDLWDAIMRATYDYSEPGVLFIDRINRENNLWFCEEIAATNPCVAEGTRVATPDGWRKVEDITTGDLILAADGKHRPVRSIEVHSAIPTYRVTLANGAQCLATAAHIFHSMAADADPAFGWDRNSRLDRLKVGDYIRVLETRDDSLDGAVSLPPAQRDTGSKIVSIAPAGVRKVYDLYEPVTDTWITEGGIVSRGCGEQPLPENGACLLGSIDLTQFVKRRFAEDAIFDFPHFRSVVATFARMLDNVIELNGLPLEAQRAELLRKRRHGMGFFGLGSTLAMLGIGYGREDAAIFAKKVAQTMAVENWRAGLALAREKGPAPIMEEIFEVTHDIMARCPDLADANICVGELVDGKVLLAYSPYMRRLATIDPSLVGAIATHGSRFTHATSIAPTGTISLSFGNNASNGIEPSFSHEYIRNVIVDGKKTKREMLVQSAEAYAWAAQDAGNNPLPASCVTASELTPEEHLDVVCAVQPWIDSSISKTVNLPADISFDAFKDVYRYAYENGAKGCATFRYNPEKFQGVLVKPDDLQRTTYRFALADGSTVTAKGDDLIEYDGELHTAANLHDAIKEGTYGRY